MSSKLKRKNILVVAAHPDDEVLGCGGTIARHTQHGDRVTLVVMTDGVGSRDYQPASRRSAGKRSAGGPGVVKRKRECAASCRILGIDRKDIHWLGLADQCLDGYLLLDLVKRLEEVKILTTPDIVYTHFWGDLNLDHQLTCRAVLTAFRPMPSGKHARVFQFEVPESTYLSIPLGFGAFNPDSFDDITVTVERKLLALKAYNSESRVYPHCRSTEFIKELSLFRGKLAGCLHAEAFVSLKGWGLANFGG